ncbi:MAG: acyloxyacyl hydrolase [Xylophilus ampelinus]
MPASVLFPPSFLRSGRILALPVLAALSGLAATGAQADPLATRTIYGQLGVAQNSAGSLTAGVTAPIGWQSSFWGMRAGAYWDANIAYWSARDDADNRRHGYAQIGLTPTLRLRFDEGRSPWFADAGIGISLNNHLYNNENHHFSTAFNFASHIGAGYSFGANRSQEISLRLQHVSNASIKQPNPGENFLQLRYAVAF